MKHWFCSVVIAALLPCAISAADGGKKGKSKADFTLPSDAHELKIGELAPDFSLLGVDGKQYSLANFKGAKVLMVVFLSNHCPYSHAAENRLLPLYAETKARGVAVVAINPNHPDAVRIDELGYSKYNDSFDEMKLYSKEKGFTFPYLYDGETQATAKAYGCLATPHVFLFDQERRLRYQGRFDDSRFPDPATVTSPDTRNALEAILSGKPVAVEVTRAMGCSTKWLSKQTDAKVAEEKWDNTPVSLEQIDAAGVNALVHKNTTKKVRLINVWATWCGPCVHEFPNLVSLSRRLGNRDFEIITISIDDPKDQDKARNFLQQKHAAMPNRVKRSVDAEGRKSNNYLFTGKNTDELAAALDPEWPGPVPYTVIVTPDGKVVYRHLNEVDPVELRAKILEVLGPYYTADSP